MEQGTRSDERREIEGVGWRVREEEDGRRREEKTEGGKEQCGLSDSFESGQRRMHKTKGGKNVYISAHPLLPIINSRLRLVHFD